MSITYGSAAGTKILSFLVSTTCGAQGGGLLANQVDIPNATPSANTGYGGNVGVGTLGVGDTFVGRRILFDRGLSTEEERIVSSISGTTLTLHEDLINTPVSGTTFDLFYELADVEEGGAGGGISFATRTGLWTLTRIITVGDGTIPAGLAMHGGQALECADRGAANSFLMLNNGYFRLGYYSGGLPISGGIITLTAATNDEPAMDFNSGADVAFLDALIWAQVATLSQISNTGASVIYDKVNLLKGSEECELYGDTITDLSLSGLSGITEIARVDSATSCKKMVLVDIQALDSAADTTAETIELSGVVFSGVAGFVDVRQNKTWNLIDPVWSVLDYTDLTWTGTSTGNELNDKRSVYAVVQQSDGTKLQNAVVNVYEHSQLLDLVIKTFTDIDGVASDSFTYKKHATNSVTTTYGSHALQAGKWEYLPFVSSQVSTDKFLGAIVLSPDNNINQTVQATALSAGSTITWNEDTNDSELFDFTLGSGTLVDGMIITFSPSGAVGTITKSMSGDSVSGEIHLKDRDATAITNSDTFSRTGGAAGTFSGTYTNDSKQPFTVWIDGKNLGFQVIYDYIAALTTETTLSATGELIWEWCRSAQAQALYSTGSSFFTEQSNSKGIIVVDGGAGTFDYATDNNNSQWIPPVSITVTFTGMKDNTEVRVYETGTNIEIAGIEDATSGSVDDRSFAWSASASDVVDYKIHHWSGSSPFYLTIFKKDYTVPSNDVTIDIVQGINRNAS